MDRTVAFYLVGVERTQDEYGVWRETTSERKCFGQKDSVTQNEFFSGGRIGLNPEFRISMFAYDYHNEPMLICDGKRYAIYRTYFNRNDTIELYCQREGGTNATQSN